jgi:hypothetical protein
MQWELTHKESAAGEHIRSQVTAYGAGTAMEDYERAGDPGFTQYAASLGSQISAIRSSSAGRGAAGPVNNSRTTNTGGDVNVGPVVVNGRADPYMVGGAVADAIKRERLVTTFNSGQE